jgi:outer membrane biosynthesis protein TonB
MEHKKLKQNNMEAFLVKEYEQSGNSRNSGSLAFGLTVVLFMTLAMIGAALLGKVDISEVKQLARLRKMDVSFLMKQEKKPVEKKTIKPKKKVVKKPIKRASLKTEINTAVKTPVKKVVKRKVYGLRKVYSRGLGSGYSGGNAVVAKLGNSLNLPVDTVKATKQDLKGPLVSVTKISRMPSIVKAAKPEYTAEMKENNISGKVKAKVLVDVDGTAKKIIIVKHLGYGTRDSSITAIRKMRFKPGILDDAPVAVWIPLTFRFELQV